MIIYCPRCQAKLDAPAELIGKEVACPGCGENITVTPRPDHPAAASEPAAPSAADIARMCRRKVVGEWRNCQRDLWYKIISIGMFALLAFLIWADIDALIDCLSGPSANNPLPATFRWGIFGLCIFATVFVAWMHRIMTYLADIRDK